MAKIIRFRDYARTSPDTGLRRAESATVIILPIIRIERYTDEPPNAGRPVRRRRKLKQKRVSR